MGGGDETQRENAGETNRSPEGGSGKDELTERVRLGRSRPRQKQSGPVQRSTSLARCHDQESAWSNQKTISTIISIDKQRSTSQASSKAAKTKAKGRVILGLGRRRRHHRQGQRQESRLGQGQSCRHVRCRKGTRPPAVRKVERHPS